MSIFNTYSLKDKLILLLLAAGICCFGLILPDSLSDHNKLVHFSAHFGMSFLLALCFYMICTVKIRMPKSLTYTILVLTTLLIGVVYKFWELLTEGMFGKYELSTVIKFTGVMTSMSQNLSGVLAAILLIEGLVVRNLSISALSSGNYYSGPGSFQGISLNQRLPGNISGPLPGENLVPGSPFPREASEHEFR
jgi:hypothetical protein